MKALIIAITLLSATSSFASKLSARLDGEYAADPVTCGGVESVSVSDLGDHIYVEGVSKSGETVRFGSLSLGTRGKKVDCAGGGSYGDVWCKVTETRKQIKVMHQGCLSFICGPWHMNLSLKEISKNRVELIGAFDRPAGCLLNKKN